MQPLGVTSKKTHESFADLNYDIYAPDGSFIDRNDSQAVLTLQWVPQDGQDKDYGYCYTIRENNQDKQRCWHDSDMSWADTRGFRSGGAESDILIPNAPFFLQYPKRVIITNSGQYKAEVYTDSNKYKLIMPWDCRHDFCANGYEWGNKDLGKQTNKLMEQNFQGTLATQTSMETLGKFSLQTNTCNPYVAFIYGQNPNDGTFEDPMDREEWQKIEDMKAVGNMIEQLDVRFYSVEAGDDPTDTNKTRNGLPSPGG